MSYGFVLEWDDLDEGLQQEKIEAFVAYQDANGGYEGADFDGVAAEKVQWAKQLCAENAIKSRFPIYF